MSHSLTAGTQIEKYLIDHFIARGATSWVYRAQDLRLNRPVALKQLVLAPEIVIDSAAYQQIVRRFYHEAQIVASLQHPHILRVYDVFESAQQHFLSTELVEVPTLDVYAVQPQHCLRELLRVLGQVADGLAYAHGQGVIHRDIKPENIAVCPERGAKILDFGTAKSRDITSQTLDGSILGTLGYMSPEQLLNSRTIDQRSDIYAFGAMVYHLLTGFLPFDGEGLGDTIQQIFTAPLLLPHERCPGVPPALSAVIAQAMSRDPDQRYQSMLTLQADLRRLEKLLDVKTLAMTVLELRRQPVADALAAGGSFDAFGFPDLLAGLLQARKSLCLCLTGPGGLSARVFLETGRLHAVEWAGAPQAPIDCLYEITSWEKADYTLQDLVQPEAQTEFDYMPLDLLLADLALCRDRLR